MEHFAKRVMPEILQDKKGGRFVGLGHFNKDFVKNSRQKRPCMETF